MRKNLGIVFLMFGICLAMNINAQAATITLTDSSLLTNTILGGTFDLWDVNFTPAAGQTIESVTLNIDDVYAFSGQNNNPLSFYLDNSVSNPLKNYGLIEVNHNSNGSNWVGLESNKIKSQLEGTLINTFDVNKLSLSRSGKPITQNLSYTFDAAQIDQLITDDADGSFAIGIDPPAFFVDNGIDLVITTGNTVGVPPSATPEPATMAMFALGTLGLFGLRKRKLVN